MRFGIQGCGVVRLRLEHGSETYAFTPFAAFKSNNRCLPSDNEAALKSSIESVESSTVPPELTAEFGHSFGTSDFEKLLQTGPNSHRRIFLFVTTTLGFTAGSCGGSEDQTWSKSCRCAAHSAGRGFAMRWSSVRSHGWVPSRMACCRSGARNARAMSRRPY
jgi:hypothetical protein